MVQATVCPIAEFSSQLPLWLSAGGGDASAVNSGVAAWHAGVLISVLIAGWLLDQCTLAQRGMLLAFPILANAGIFYLASSSSRYELDTTQSRTVLSLMLGATYAPANYLTMTTWVMRHAKTRRAMPIVSAGIDVGGYMGTIILLQLQALGGLATDPTTVLMQCLMYSGCLCATLLGMLFFFESRGVSTLHEVGGRRSKEKVQ